MSRAKRNCRFAHFMLRRWGRAAQYAVKTSVLAFLASDNSFVRESLVVCKLSLLLDVWSTCFDSIEQVGYRHSWLFLLMYCSCKFRIAVFI